MIMPVHIGAAAPVIAQWISFQQPGFAVAAAALIAVPWLIHFLNRRRYRREPWAAMQFLFAADSRHRRRIRVEQWLLLILRTLLIAAIPLAAARPSITSSVLADAPGARRHHIVLLDDSLSMQSRCDQDRTCFDVAVARSRWLLDSFAPDDPISLIRLTEPDSPVLIRCRDQRAAMDALSAMTPTFQHDDPAVAINAACALLDEPDGTPLPAAVYLISDLPASSWTDSQRGDTQVVIDAIKRLTERAPLNMIHCPPADTSNVAVTRLAFERHTFQRDAPLQMTVRIDNFSPRVASSLELEIISAARILRRIPVPAVAAHAHVVVPVSAAPQQPGEIAIEARTRQPNHDALAPDDSRFAIASWGRAINVLIVENRTDSNMQSGSGTYLAAATAPARSIDPPTWISTRRITADALSTQVLDDYRLIALCDVNRLDPILWRRVAAYAHRGGALLVAAGESMDCGHYNDHAVESTSLLPVRFADVIEPADGDPPWRISRSAPSPRLINAFSSAEDTSLFRATLQRMIRLESVDASHEVLLETRDNTPLLVTAQRGAGRVAVFASTLDMRWNNLPARGDFVALAQQIVSELVPVNGHARDTLAGHPYRRPLRAEESMQTVRWIKPGGAEAVPGFDRVNDTRVISIEDPDAIGVHRVGTIGHEEPFAVNIDPAECDLAPADKTDLLESLPGGVGYVNAKQDTASTLPAFRVGHVARYLLVAALLLVALEIYVASRRRALWQVA